MELEEEEMDEEEIPKEKKYELFQGHLIHT